MLRSPREVRTKAAAAQDAGVADGLSRARSPRIVIPSVLLDPPGKEDVRSSGVECRAGDSWRIVVGLSLAVAALCCIVIGAGMLAREQLDGSGGHARFRVGRPLGHHGARSWHPWSAAHSAADPRALEASIAPDVQRLHALLSDAGRHRAEQEHALAGHPGARSSDFVNGQQPEHGFRQAAPAHALAGVQGGELTVELHPSRRRPELWLFTSLWYHEETMGAFLEYALARGRDAVIYHSGRQLEAHRPVTWIPYWLASFSGSGLKITLRHHSSFVTDWKDHEHSRQFDVTAPDVRVIFLTSHNSFTYLMRDEFAYVFHLKVHLTGTPEGTPEEATDKHFKVELSRYRPLLRDVRKIFLTPIVGTPFMWSVFARHILSKPIRTLADRRPEMCIVGAGAVVSSESYTDDLTAFVNQWGTRVQVRAMASSTYLGRSALPAKHKHILWEGAVPTERLLEILAGCRWALIYPRRTSRYFRSQLTGLLPLAFALNTPIVTSRDFAALYGLDEQYMMLYNTSLSEIAAKLVSPAPDLYNTLVARQRAATFSFLEQNNKVLDRVLLDSRASGAESVAFVDDPRLYA